MAQVGMLVTTTARTTGTMRLDEIVTEICKRVNDPFEDNYAERARELFVASVYQGYKDPKYTKFDYHGLVGSRNFSTGGENKKSYRIFGDNNEISGDTGNFRRYILDIIDIVSEDVSEKNPRTRKFVPIDTSEANRIATDVELEPIKGEVYWYIAGDRLYFHPSPVDSAEMRGINFIIEYLIGLNNFGDTEDMLDHFSAVYVYDSIDVATGKLLAEIGLA
jgi:hypothetical protein